jgi:Na+-driven multidrug efflux pump
MSAGRERAVLLSVVLGGITNVTVAIPFAHRYGARGMAWSVVLAELAVVTALLVAQFRSNAKVTC